MKMRNWIGVTAVVAGVLIAGCTTMTPEERRAQDRETCRAYGFKKKNDAMAECMQRLDLDRRNAMRQNRAELDDWERGYWRSRYGHWGPYYDSYYYGRGPVVYRPIPIVVKEKRRKRH